MIPCTVLCCGLCVAPASCFWPSQVRGNICTSGIKSEGRVCLSADLPRELLKAGLEKKQMQRPMQMTEDESYPGSTKGGEKSWCKAEWLEQRGMGFCCGQEQQLHIRLEWPRQSHSRGERSREGGHAAAAAAAASGSGGRVRDKTDRKQR